MAHQPVFDLGTVAAIPARSDWDLRITCYVPTATSAAAANAAVLAVEDLARFRLFAEDDVEPLILATDEEASSGGTTVTIDTRGVAATTAAQVTVKLSAADTDLTNGSYLFLLDIYDDSDARWQPACRGVITIEAGPAAVEV